MKHKSHLFPLAFLLAVSVDAAVVGTSGTVALEAAPYPPASDTMIFVFDERQEVPFVASQSLNFGTIAAGTPVNSHYVQYDPVSPTGLVGGGTITFDGPVLGVITSTQFLDQDLSADGAGTSDSYFGLADSLGPYPTGADPGSRGLGSAEDDLVIVLGSDTITIDSLQIPVSGNLDGFRVLTGIPPSDQDGDGVDDSTDNCTVLANPGQHDTNGDGIGNACDPDFDQTCQVDFADLSLFKAGFFGSNPDLDLTGAGETPDGIVNFADLSRMKALFFGPPGPSASGCNSGESSRHR